MCWMKTNKLNLNPAKMEVLLVGSGFCLGSGLIPTLGGVALTLSMPVCKLLFLTSPGSKSTT